MEKLGDRCLRRVVAKIGGVDECCTEFLRVPSVPPEPRLRYLEGISKQHDPSELAEYGVPLAVQVGGSSLCFSLFLFMSAFKRSKVVEA